MATANRTLAYFPVTFPANISYYELFDLGNNNLGDLMMLKKTVLHFLQPIVPGQFRIT